MLVPSTCKATIQMPAMSINITAYSTVVAASVSLRKVSILEIIASSILCLFFHRLVGSERSFGQVSSCHEITRVSVIAKPYVIGGANDGTLRVFFE